MAKGMAEKQIFLFGLDKFLDYCKIKTERNFTWDNFTWEEIIMKWTLLFIAVLVFCSNSAMATIWYDSEGAESLPPQSYPWNGGYVIANSYNKGPIAVTWDTERMDNPGFSLVHHHQIVTQIIGAWVDNGGGKRPLYYTYQQDEVVQLNGSPFFYNPGDSRLLYLSTADVDESNGISQDDYRYVLDTWWRGVKSGLNTDVNRNGETSRIDSDIVTSLYGTEPDPVLLEIQAELPQIPFEEFQPIAIPAAPGRHYEEPELFDLTALLSGMDLAGKRLTTTWGALKK